MRVGDWFVHSTKQLEELGRELREYLKAHPSADEEDVEVLRFKRLVSDLVGELERQHVEVAILGSGPRVSSPSVCHGSRSLCQRFE